MWKSNKLLWILALSLLVLPIYSTNTEAILSDDLVFCLSLDDADTSGSTAIDTVGNINFEISGGVTTGQTGANAKIGEAYLFDGTNGELLNTSIGIGNDMTMITWIKTNDGTANTMVFGSDESGARSFQARGSDPGDVLEYIDFATGGCTATGTSDFVDDSFHQIVYKTNSTDNSVFFDGNQEGTCTHGGNSLAEQTHFFIATRNTVAGGGEHTLGIFDEVMVWNRSLSAAEISSVYNAGAGLSCSTVSGANVPLFSDNKTNNTAPRITDVIQINITVTADTGSTISGFIFSWDNGTGTLVNDSFVDLGNVNNIENLSINRTIEVSSGTTIQYKWFANDSGTLIGESGTFTVLIAGNESPNIIINTNNFFSGDNSSIVGLNASQTALLNISFTDDISLFGFEINITDPLGNLHFNLTNESLTGTFDNFTQIINVSGIQGFYNVTIEASDTHTARLIPDYRISKGFTYLRFDEQIRIEAEGAIWSSTRKSFDRYNFQFRYLPLISPTRKVFYVESVNDLILIKDSGIKAHFVDPIAGKWIDFEGVEGRPIITRITNKKYKVEFNHVGSTIEFNSIGGLNRNVFHFQYYLSNVSLNWIEPPTTVSNFLGSEFSVSLNVTGNGRNFTRFKLFNSSNDLIQTINVSDTGTGSFAYDATFSGLTDVQFFVNITHTDVTGENSTLETLTLNSITLTTCEVGFPTINFTLRNESDLSTVIGDTTGSFSFNGSIKTESLAISELNTNNFSICIFPANELLVADYSLFYSALNFPERQKSVSNTILTNTTQTVDLLLLNSADGIFATFKTLDSFQNSIQGVTVENKITATNASVETRITDDAGIATFFVDPDTLYTFTFSKPGFLTVSFTLRITSTDLITVTMQPEITDQPFSVFTGVDYFFVPSDTAISNNTLINFSFNMTSSFWNITGCTFTIKNATTTFTSSSTTFNGSECKIPIALNTGNQSLLIGEATWELNNTQNTTVTIQWSVIHVFQGEFSLRTFIDDINNFTEAGFNDFTRFLLAVIIISSISFWATKELSAIRNEQEIVLTLALVLIFIFSSIGWMGIPYDAIPDIRGLPSGWLNQWMTFIFSTLAVLGYIFSKRN